MKDLHLLNNAEEVEDFQLLTPPAALEIPEDSLIAELAILEYLLHQSIVLRLNNLFPADPFLPASESASNLKRAQYFTEIIQQMLSSLKESFGGDSLPFDESLQRRLAWAKFIGFLFFFKRNDNCWDGKMNKEEVRHGLLSGFHYFYELFPTKEMISEIPSALQMLIELKTQVFLQMREVDVDLEKLLLPDWDPSTFTNITIPKDPFTPTPDYLKKCHLRYEIINKKNADSFPWINFARQMNGLLRNLYRDFEEPIIAKFCKNLTCPQPVETQFNATMTQVRNEESQMQFMTQSPDLLFPLSIVNNTGNDTVNEERQQVPIEKSEADSNESLSLDLDSLESIPKKRSTNEIDVRKEIPERLSKLIARFPIIPAEAFRSVYCPDDIMLAEIIEAEDENVAKFINNFNKLTQGKRPKHMLERHESAEKIKWTQDTTSSPASHKAGSAGGRRPWSEEEEKNLVDGYRRFGHNWAQIQEHYKFNSRTNVNLKDKDRNLQKKGILEK